MTKTRLLPLLLLAIVPVGARAQRFQNSDMYYVAGPVSANTQVIGGSNVTLYGSTGYAFMWGFGHQLKRIGGASLWLDVPLVFTDPSHQTATIPGSITLGAAMLVPGVRLMLPLQSRISVFGIAGGGGGFFTNPYLESTNPVLTTNIVNHGVIEAGGGVDIRLSDFFSIRLDVRDFIAGRNLGGVTGRNDIIPMLGFALHSARGRAKR